LTIEGDEKDKDLVQNFAHKAIRFLMEQEELLETWEAVDIQDDHLKDNLLDALWYNIDSMPDKVLEKTSEHIRAVVDLGMNPDTPAWHYFMVKDLVSPQPLVHFTNKGIDIIKNGFDNLVADMSDLGVTGQGHTMRSSQGYGFAFRPNDIPHNADR
jgi:hypothetical protein